MNTEALIHQLAAQVRPVRPVGRPITRSVMWVLVAVTLAVLAVFITGIRPDIAAVFDQPMFLFRALCMLAVGITATFAAFSLAIPGNTEKWPVVASGIGIAVFLGLLCFSFLSTGNFSPGPGMYCLRNVLGLGIVTGSFLYLMLKRAAPLRSGLVGLLAALGAASVANLGTQFICRHENPAHILVWHLIPAAVLCGFGILAGRLLFRWDEEKRSGTDSRAS